MEYNALGQPKRYLLGGSSPVAQTFYGIDYQTTLYPIGALRTIRWPESGTALVDRTMSYDQVGNVTQIADAVNSETINYGYDDLDRLTSAGSPIDETYAYNEIGNLTSKNSKSYSYGDPAHKHAVTSFDGHSCGYDPNGSMTTRDQQALRYDPQRRPVKVTQGAEVLWRAAYAGDGGRRKRLDAGGTVHYVGSYERNVGNGQDTTETVTKYYHALGRPLAFRKGGTLYWVGTDHLGGTVRVANSSFSPIARKRYTPTGSPGTPTRRTPTTCSPPRCWTRASGCTGTPAGHMIPR